MSNVYKYAYIRGLSGTIPTEQFTGVQYLSGVGSGHGGTCGVWQGQSHSLPFPHLHVGYTRARDWPGHWSDHTCVPSGQKLFTSRWESSPLPPLASGTLGLGGVTIVLAETLCK